MEGHSVTSASEYTDNRFPLSNNLSILLELIDC